MKVVKKLLGKMIQYISKGLGVIFNGLIALIESMVFYIGGFLKGFIALASMGGCLFFIFFFNIGIRILTDPGVFPIVVLLVLFLMYGGRLVSHLKYLKYIITEFLMNTGNHFINPDQYKYKTMYTYKEAYRKVEEERIRAEQARYYQQQREWEERVRQSFYQQGGQGGYQGYYGGYSGNNGFGSQGFANPSSDFRHKYEKSCDVLGVAYNVNKQAIKTAYRQKAKEYHPDLNKNPEATKIFQEINSAYEFLTDENIERYSRL